MNIRKTRILIALSSLSLGVLAGCGLRTDRQPVDAIIAIDVSSQARSRLLGYARAVYRIERQLPSGSQLRVYLFGHGCDPIYVGGKIGGRDAFNTKIASALANPPKDLALPGTQTDRLLVRIASDVAGSTGPAVVVIATDGGIEDQGEEAMGRLRRGHPEFEIPTQPTGCGADICPDAVSDPVGGVAQAIGEQGIHSR